MNTNDDRTNDLLAVIGLFLLLALLAAGLLHALAN